jgi:transposase InsO family protein
LYLATVLDLCSRRLLGYAFSHHHDAALTEAALQMAVTTRIGEGRTLRGVVFHSDRGSEDGGARELDHTHTSVDGPLWSGLGSR